MIYGQLMKIYNVLLFSSAAVRIQLRGLKITMSVRKLLKSNTIVNLGIWCVFTFGL